VIVLSAVASTIAAIKLIHATRRRSVPVQAVLHGYLNDIVGWRSRNPLRRVCDLRSALEHWRDPKLEYVVLEEPIRSQLVALIPGIEDQVVCLNHPFPASETNEKANALCYPIRIGFLGLATPQKGFDVFLAMAKKIKSIRGSLVEFHAFGRLMNGVAQQQFEFLETSPVTAGLPRREYLENVRRLHYVCLPYLGNHYELSPSGVLLDAIGLLKPIIGLPSPVLRGLFSSQPMLGTLCESPDELTDRVLELTLDLDQQLYESRIDALRTLREGRSTRTLARRYTQITNQLRQLTFSTQ
jgi:hypothetical protein